MYDELLNNEKPFITSFSIKEVENLYFEIDNYVKSNYLFVKEDDRYYIKYNNNFYECGFYYGPDILFYLRFIGKQNIKEYVDYEDFKMGRISETQKEIKDQINSINDAIESLTHKGISRKLIKQSINL